MPRVDVEIRTLVDSFVAELTALVRRSAVEAAVNALKGAADVAASSRRRVARRGAAQVKADRRSPKEIQRTLSRVVAYVEANPASRSEDIKKGLKLSAAQTGDALSRLVESKTLKRKGQRRASTYTKS